MGLLRNAADLARDDDFKALVTAGIAYTAQRIISDEDAPGEDSFLAYQALVQPGVFTERFVWLCATTPDVAQHGGTLTEAHEGPTLDRIEALWHPVASRLYPEAASPPGEEGQT